MDPKQVRTGENDELGEDDVITIDLTVLLRDREHYVRAFLKQLCSQLVATYKIDVKPRWVIDDDGDVQFKFMPKPTLQYAADPVAIATAAKSAWCEMRAKHPRVFLGGPYKKFVEQYGQLVTLDDLREMPDDDFAKLFQKRSKR